MSAPAACSALTFNQPSSPGVDLSETELDKARDKFPELEFHRIDAFDIGKLLALRRKHNFNKIFLDINGSRDVSAVAKLISIYADAWGESGTGEIHTIVVKNCASQQQRLSPPQRLSAV